MAEVERAELACGDGGGRSPPRVPSCEPHYADGGGKSPPGGSQEALWGHSGATLGLSWAILGQSWAIVGRWKPKIAKQCKNNVFLYVFGHPGTPPEAP